MPKLCRMSWLYRTVAGACCLAMLAAPEAHAQTVAQTPAYSSAGAINLGGRGWGGSDTKHAATDTAKSQLESEVRGGLTSNYVYRGVTLSDRKPAAGMAIEATYNVLYAGVAVASVKLPTQPAAEISMSGGIRPTVGPVDFDLGVIYYRYPGEDPAAQSN